MVGNVLLLLVFLLIIFGVLSVALTGDSVAQQCVKVEANGTVATDGSYGLGYGFEVLESTSVEWQLCAMHPRNAWQGYSCPAGYECRHNVGYPNWGMFRFDTVPWAMLNIFIIISLERWSLAMYWVQDATSGWAAIYFVILIFIGSFFVLNLTLAVRLRNPPAQQGERTLA